MELDHKLVESTKDGDLVLALNAGDWFRKINAHITRNTCSKTGLLVQPNTLFLCVNSSGRSSRMGSITSDMAMRSIRQRQTLQTAVLNDKTSSQTQ